MATMTVEGRRVWVQTRYGEPCVEKLKGLGCHWDAETRRWWIGSGKAKEVEQILAETGAGFDLRKADDRAVRADQLEEEGRTGEAKEVREAQEDVGGCRVYAKVEYKGKTYYVIAESKDRTRCRLTTLDGGLIFWADMPACKLLKEYRPREAWDGRRNSGRTVTKYTTIGSIREFVEGQKQARATGEPACAACGRHLPLQHDLEDGLMKCRACCDMPE